MIAITTKSSYRKFLKASSSASVLLLVMVASPALAEDADEAAPTIAPAISTVAQAAPATSANPVVETNRYFMRLMTQVFDGSKQFSHTQTAAFARKRQDNLSWTMLDFGDGAVVITQPETLSVGGFKNTSKAEFGVLYNYDTKTIEGNSPVAKFHNNYVRPQLDRAPALGSNVSWSTQMPISALGVSGLSGQQVKLELSREYFTHDGKPMVLLQYKVPALRFDSGSGAMVIHWGRGFALTDPGFGNIYASAALHRSVADEGDAEARPYRYYRAGFASSDDGKPMVDIKKVPAVARIYDDYFSENALQAIPFDDDTGAADQRPVTLAANIDVMALSIAENGANDGGVLAGAQVNGDRGNERATILANEIGARAMVGDQTIFVQNSSQDIVRNEAVDMMQGNGSTIEPESFGGPVNSGRSSGSGFTIPDGTLENLQNSQNTNSDPFANVRGGPNKEATFGNPGNGNNGTESSTIPSTISGSALINSAAGNTYNWARIAEGSQQEQQVFLTIESGLANWQVKADSISESLYSTAKRINQLQAQIDNTPGSFVSTPTLDSLEADMIARGEDFKSAQSKLRDTLNKYGPDNTSLSSEAKQTIRNNALTEYKDASFRNEFAITTFEEALQEPSLYRYEAPTGSALTNELADAKNTLNNLVMESYEHQNSGYKIVTEIQDIPATRFEKFKGGLGTGLQVLGDAFNGYTIGVGLANLQKQGSKNLAYGDAPALTRTYGTALSGDQSGFTAAGLLDLGLGFDLLGLAVKDPLTAAAVVTGSFSDLVVSGKALKDINVVNTEAAKLGRDLARRQKEQYAELSFRLKAEFEQEIRDLDYDIMVLDEYSDEADQALKDRMTERGIEDPNNRDPNRPDPRFDPDTGLPSPAYWAYLKEESPQTLVNMGIDPNAPVGGWPAEQDTGLTREELIAGLAEEINKEDYPTAPPRNSYVKDKEDPAEANLGKTSELSQAQLDTIATAQRKQAAQDKLDAEQAERAKDLPPLDNFETPEERQTYYQEQLDAAQAERAAGLPPLDNFETPAERKAYYQQKLNEAQAERSKDLPPIDNFETPEERRAYYQQQLNAAEAERTSGLAPVDNFKSPAERQAFYQKQLDDAQAERSKDLPPLDNFKTPDERRIANQKTLDDQQAERTKGLPQLDNFKTPDERKDAFQKQLDDTLEQRLADRNKETDRERGAPLEISELKTSDLTVSKFDIKPITFTPVTFDDANFDEDNDLFDEDGNLRKVGPDDFELTTFDAPDISTIEFSNFADDDYPGGNHIPAFTYENMSGTVETDLGQWEEWLMTQDIAKLERLARQAGYPNLASALNDAKNLIRQADDDGYRKWAMSQPPCSPSGCGPNYQGRWAMKRSTLALGDILRADRAFFSSAGLSDISIAGLRLMFSIIDFGIDDGDRVNISVTQFGRSLLNQSLTINTGGTAFDIPVQRGVVAVNMTALNTGEFPPNTAALNITGVSGGDSNQDFSLQEGDTAGLRVTVGEN